MRRSLFDLSYSKTMTMDMGLLYPVMHDEVYPGDHFTIGNTVVARMQPMVSPCLTPITLYAYYFFVPYRILDSNWEEFITGGQDGQSNVVLPRVDFDVTKPDYATSGGLLGQIYDYLLGYRPDYCPYDVGSLWDFMGMPIRKKPLGDAAPMMYPFLAYMRVWWEYFRDENLVADSYKDVVLECQIPYLFPVAWKKDYFTSALPWQQRGIAPALPLSGMASAQWPAGFFDTVGQASGNFALQAQRNSTVGGVTGAAILTTNTSTKGADMANLMNMFNSNRIDLSSIGTFTSHDWRMMMKVQLWMERNARYGSRYVEVIKAHFGFAPKDDRLQRPEFIGGTKLPIVVSEVLQTSETTQNSPQGAMSGHGMSVDGSFVGKYHVKEHGIILGLAFIRPEAAYQDGINRQWLRRTRYDFFWREFEGLSEQAIENSEIFTTDNDATINMGIWAYQGRYDELRHKRDIVCGQMRSYENKQSEYGQGMTMPTQGGAPTIPPSLDYWNLGRSFKTLPPYSWAFMLCQPSKRIMAVLDEPAFIIQFRNNIKAVRPLSRYAVPSF